jgi:hypothetical protein
VRLYRNEQPLGEQKVELTPGKNLYTFPQTLEEAEVLFVFGTRGRRRQRSQEQQGDQLRECARRSAAARGFRRARARPFSGRGLAIGASRGQGRGHQRFPGSLAEMQSYDAIFISNLAAGDLGEDNMKLLSAVRDFSVGLVCVGGDQTYAAGGYRGTLEATLPVNMELDSRRNSAQRRGGAGHARNGVRQRQPGRARDCALGVLDALGPPTKWRRAVDELRPLAVSPHEGGAEQGRPREKIAGMNQGDLPSFQNVMTMGYEGLKKSTANLKHAIVFSDGDPGAPSQQLMQASSVRV